MAQIDARTTGVRPDAATVNNLRLKWLGGNGCATVDSEKKAKIRLRIISESSSGETVSPGHQQPI
jgi:hypothetical protein